ncbi:MAG: hypothetical protein ACOZJZ_20405 [Pseudomonadota bacterium]
MNPRETTPGAAGPAAAPRHDIYGPIHKALRLLMTRALNRFGAVDVGDDRDLGDALAELDRAITVRRLHLAHENRHVHPALEAVAPGAAVQAAQDHKAHRAELDALAGDLRALRSAARHDRDRIARHIYRALARFVADNLVHMAHEEKAHNAVLWAAYDDAALQALEARIVADTEPTAMQLVLASMLPALNAAERCAMLAGMKAGMPGEAFGQVLGLAQRVLDVRAWSALARDLGLPPRPAPLTT